ncbi:MAG: 8-oxoguanine deaminase [Ignavibacteria bacterium]|jgi:cytosine/adenosine deaminase-related metal-dependent hydrolase|nr:8-oxoguanine deaminase [Ignavibacteria bacterium]MCU7502305.1 8-oxoguanine deaminase [Ignavibacteria bacterium]MCU7516651.1 8-oxoguanine deaminase [Ignavibacteria bacterium]
MLLLKNCSYIAAPENGGIITNSDILIEANKIKQISKGVWEDPDIHKTLDCSGCIVIPGLVNTHHHFFQTLTRNLPDVQNAKLFDWLTYLYEIWKNIDRDAVYYSTMLAVGELLKTGCTLTTDHHYLYPENFMGDLIGTQFEAAGKLGIRFSPSRGSMSLGRKQGGLPPDSVIQSEEAILEDSQRVIEEYNDPSEDSMRRIVLAPCSPFSVTKANMRKTAQLARKYNVRLHTHLAETKDEEAFCNDVFGKNPLALMEEVEFLGEDVFFAHGVFFNDEELRVLANTKTSIAHCPSSNMRLGSGVARVKDMLKLGINVGLAVDGSASNDTSDMLAELRNALLLQRVINGADALRCREVFKMATENGARMLNFSKTGKIKPGYLADLAVFDLNRLEYTGSLSDPLAALIFSGISHQTKYTIVNGKVTVENGYLVGEDEEYLIKKGNEASERLLKVLRQAI